MAFHNLRLLACLVYKCKFETITEYFVYIFLPKLTFYQCMPDLNILWYCHLVWSGSRSTVNMILIYTFIFSPYKVVHVLINVDLLGCGVLGYQWAYFDNKLSIFVIVYISVYLTILRAS